MTGPPARGRKQALLSGFMPGPWPKASMAPCVTMRLQQPRSAGAMLGHTQGVVLQSVDRPYGWGLGQRTATATEAPNGHILTGKIQLIPGFSLQP